MTRVSVIALVVVAFFVSCGVPYEQDSARLDAFLGAINTIPWTSSSLESVQASFSEDTTDGGQTYADLATADFWNGTYFAEIDGPWEVTDRAEGSPDSRFADSSTITARITNNSDITDDVTFVFVPSPDDFSTRLLRAIFVDVATAGTIRSVGEPTEDRQDWSLF